MLTNGTFAFQRRSLLRKSLRTGVVLVIGVVLAGPLWAQDEGRMVGFRFGAITTGVDSEADAFLNTDWRTGLSAGGFVSIDPASHLTLGAGILFSQRGFGFRMYHESTGLIPGQAEVRSLEVQMDVGLRLPWPKQSASARVFAGPALGFELSCKVSGSILGMEFNEQCNTSAVGLETQTVDLGFSFGGGIDLHFQPFTIVFDGRYTHGLRNLNKDPQGSESLTSRAWTFTVGLGWPF